MADSSSSSRLQEVTKRQTSPAKAKNRLILTVSFKVFMIMNVKGFE